MDGKFFVVCMKFIDMWEFDVENCLILVIFMKVEGEWVKYICVVDYNCVYYIDFDFWGGLYCIIMDGGSIFWYLYKNLWVFMGMVVD